VTTITDKRPLFSFDYDALPLPRRAFPSPGAQHPLRRLTQSLRELYSRQANVSCAGHSFVVDCETNWIVTRNRHSSRCIHEGSPTDNPRRSAFANRNQRRRHPAACTRDRCSENHFVEEYEYENHDMANVSRRSYVGELRVLAANERGKCSVVLVASCQLWRQRK